MICSLFSIILIVFEIINGLLKHLIIVQILMKFILLNPIQMLFVQIQQILLLPILIDSTISISPQSILSFEQMSLLQNQNQNSNLNSRGLFVISKEKKEKE